MTTHIDFEAINAAALRSARSLLQEMIPGGKFRSLEYVVKNPRRDDRRPGSFSINYKTGIWRDFATNDGGSDLISLVAYVRGVGQGDAAYELADRLGVPMLKSYGSVTGMARVNGYHNGVPHEPVAAPKLFAWGNEGPPRFDNEIRRHPYERDGVTERYKIKCADGYYTNWYRVAHGWQAKKPNDYRAIPYRSRAFDPFDPELIGDDILWPEGEKDVDTLSSLNFPSFTFGGVGDGLPSDIGLYLKGRRLVILSDNDDPGRAHAERKAAVAHNAGATSIKVVHFSELPLKGDVSDFFAIGGTAEQLTTRINAAPLWAPAAITSNNNGAADIACVHNIGDDDSTQKVIVEAKRAVALTALAVHADPYRSEKESRPLTVVAENTWDDPDLDLLDDRRGALPGFPADTLDPTWQDYVERASRGAGVTIAHVAVPLITIISGLIGSARRVEASRSWTEPMTLWSAVVGFSGTGKTPGIDVSKRTLAFIAQNRREKISELQRAHETRAEAARAAQKKWRKEMEEAIARGVSPPSRPLEAADVPEFIAPRLYVSDITTERAAVLLQARPRGLMVIADELAGLFLNMGRYSNGSDREFWLEAWNGKHFVVERMGRPPVAIDHLLVGITGGLQPDKLARSFEGDADGMYARVCFAWPPEPSYRPLSNDVAEIESDLVNALTRILDLPAESDTGFASRKVPLSSDAVTTFEQFRQFLHDGKAALDGREREWWAKGASQVLRLSGTLAYMSWCWNVGSAEPQYIEREFVESAIRVWKDYLWPHSRAALRQIGITDKHANLRRVLKWIRATKRPGDSISVKDIRREALSHSIDAKHTAELLEMLERAAWLRKVTTQTRGRPAHRWEINERLFQHAGSAETAESPPTSPADTLSALPALSASEQMASLRPVECLQRQESLRASSGRPDNPGRQLES
jgi:hypothetical protein